MKEPRFLQRNPGLFESTIICRHIPHRVSTGKIGVTKHHVRVASSHRGHFLRVQLCCCRRIAGRPQPGELLDDFLFSIVAASTSVNDCKVQIFVSLLVWSQAPTPSTTCSATLSAELTEGPYYLDDILFRSDITESQPGIPVRLNVHLLDTDCNPVADAFVSIWHANASGIYSGFTGRTTC